jgi:uncharacterized protein (TIRG00374 family)
LAKNFRKILLDIIKYGIALGIAFALLWYVYRDLELKSIIAYFANINYWWLSLSIFIAIASHYIRAYRWNMMFEPLGYQLKTSRTFVAVMVGYFANNLVPRLGEVTRCGLLKKTDGVALTSAFGTVVAERALDLIILLIISMGTFILEFDKLYDFILGNFGDRFPDPSAFNRKLIAIFIIIASVFIGGVVLIRLFKDQIKRNSLFIKFRKIAKELLAGFLSIKSIKRQWTFWFLTLTIWFMYYAMLIVIFFAFPSTTNLSLMAGLTVLVMSGFGMSAPVQGGIGVFHILVSSVLVLYGISPEEGKMFALIAHSTQFLTVMVVGGICFLVSLFITKRNSYVGQN